MIHYIPAAIRVSLAGGLSAAILAAGSTPAAAQGGDTASLLAAARELPAMPRNNLELRSFLPDPTAITIASGAPFNDLAWTLYDTDYVEGETGGFDVFLPVDTDADNPGEDRVSLVYGTSNTATEVAYEGASGGRVILGLPDRDRPFYLRGADGIDDDYAVIRQFDYRTGVVQLTGDTTDYGLLYATEDDGVRTEGYYLFYVGDAAGPDLVAFLFPCWDVEPPRNGTTVTPVCSADSTLSFERALPGRSYSNFVFRPAADDVAVFPEGIGQLGGRGKEMTHGIAADDAGNVYLFGATDGNLDGDPATADIDNELFVAKLSPTGERVWVTELEQPNGALVWDGECDGSFLYVSGRTNGSLPGFTNAGGWDGFLLKLDLATGEIVAADQWGNVGLDGYGNLTLGDADHLYVSGAGSPPGQASGDSAFLVAKHRRSDLANVWRALDAAEAGATRVAEAWAGLTYVAEAGDPARGRLVGGGWFISPATPPGGANGFVVAYDDAGGATTPPPPTRSTVVSPGFRADWTLATAVDTGGAVYAAGFTTGALGSEGYAGLGDAYVRRLGRGLSAEATRQFGTPEAESFTGAAGLPDGTILVWGYTYGDFAVDGFAGANADPSGLTADVVVLRLDRDLRVLALRQLGTAGEERPFGYLRGDVLYLGGYTEGSLTGRSGGSFDGFALALDAYDLEPTASAPSSTEGVAATGSALEVWPNPAHGTLHFRLEDLADGASEVDVQLRSLSGQIARAWRLGLGGGSQTLALDGIAPGAYVLSVAGRSSFYTARVLVE